MVFDPSGGGSMDGCSCPSPILLDLACPLHGEAVAALLADAINNDHSDGPRVCSGCGERDPMWSGLPRPGWELVDGKLVCTDCLWMTSGPNPKKAA